jgi:hypothetical protein
MMVAQVTRASFDPAQLERFWRFICERQWIWVRRVQRQQPPPWTDDAVMQAERFTNIYRELDPGTQYVINAILERDAPAADKIFNTMVYRLIGRAETHQAIGFLSVADFAPDEMRAALRHIRDDEGKPPFTAAYMVSGYISMGTRDKIDNIVRLFTLLQMDFAAFYARLQSATSSEQIYDILRTAHGFGNFLAYQVTVDLLYPLERYGGKPLLPFTHDDWASAGPGAQRGIKMLLAPEVAADTLAVMRWLRTNQQAEFARLGLDFPYRHDHDGNSVPISLANIQNCLCEFHKYVKISNGTGKGRRKFGLATAPRVEQPTLF